MTGFPRTSLVLAPLLALIGGLWWFAPQPSDPGYQVTVGTLRRLDLMQARLERDVLRAHDGQLPNYDPLNSELAEMRLSADTLAADHGYSGWDQATLAVLNTEIGLEEEAVEHFKTDNALLLNSLAYVDLASMSLRADDADLKIAFLIGQLADAVLHLLRTPTTGSAERVRAGLSEIDASLVQKDTPATLGIAAATLRRHALLLADVVPAVGSDLQSVFAHSTGDQIRAMREAAERRHVAEERRATQFETAILLTTAVLVAMVVRLAVLLNAAVKRQRRRAALERAIARISTDLVARPSGDGGKAEAVAALGQAFGADRVLLFLDEEPTGQWQWTKPGVADEPWTATLDALQRPSAPQQSALWEDDLLRIDRPAKLPPGPLRDALAASGTLACFGVVLRRQARPCGVFLLQQTQPGPPWSPDEGLLRMAADVLGNAVRRQIEERKRSDLEERLTRVRRLEAVGSFASGIAHNFNNVIGAVLGHAEMAEDGLPGGAAAAHHVQEIRRAGERAQELVGRILDFGTRRRPSRELLPIDGFVAETASLLMGSLPAGSLVAAPGAPGRLVAADTVQLQQVVINLVHNGVQASEPGMAVTIRTACEHVSASRRLSHGALTPGGWVRLAVEDTGAGMDGAVLRQIFNPFFTTRPAGTGLGLATVREIIRDHGGMLDVASQPGLGTVFAVWLPLAQAPAEPDGGARAGSGQTILVLAAEQASVQRDEEMLAALGYEPVGFTRLGGALSVLAATPGRFDAMLLSADLVKDPDWAPLAEVARAAPGCPVILTLSSAADPAPLPRRGVVAVLQRPLRSTSLATALAHCVQHTASIPAEDARPLDAW